MPLDPDMARILEGLAGSGTADLTSQTPQQARALFRQMSGLLPPEPLAEVRALVLEGPAGPVPARLYIPDPGEEPAPCLVYFHGGGWVIGGLDTHDAACRRLAREAGVRVVSVDYRLAPEHPYPAAADDCTAALDAVAARAAELGVDPARLAVGGDSAGGNLAAVVARRARDRGGPPLRFQLLIYPVTDCDFDRPSYRENARGYLLEAPHMEWFWGHYVPDPRRRLEPDASPLRAADLAGLPPALVQTAEFDPLRDEGEAYAARLRQAGVPVAATRYDGLTHGFAAFAPVVARAREAAEEAAGALREALRG